MWQVHYHMNSTFVYFISIVWLEQPCQQNLPQLYVTHYQNVEQEIEPPRPQLAQSTTTRKASTAQILQRDGKVQGITDAGHDSAVYCWLYKSGHLSGG